MLFWNPAPPQGFTREQQLLIIGRPIATLFGAPQGIAPPPPTGPRMLYENNGRTMLYENDGGNMEYEV